MKKGHVKAAPGRSGGRKRKLSRAVTWSDQPPAKETPETEEAEEADEPEFLGEFEHLFSSDEEAEEAEV